MNHLRKLRKDKKLTLMQVAEQLGVTHQAVGGWEKNGKIPSSEHAIKLAKLYDCTIDEILNGEPIKPIIEYVHTDKSKQFLRIPVLGRIPAGIPFEAIQDIEDYEDIPLSDTIPGTNYFGLRIKGDSMEPEYRDGDVIIIRQQNTCSNGDDCAVMVNGDDATFKRVKISENGITLLPLNPTYDPMYFTRQEVIQLPVKIIGVVIEIRRKIRKTY